MIQKTKLLLIIFIALTHSGFSANARTTGDAAIPVTVVNADWVERLAGALKAIERPLNVATERTEDLYLYHGGRFLTDSTNVPTFFNLLNNPADATAPEDVNEYLQELAICEKYWVKAKFYEDDAFEGAGGLIQSSVPDALHGTKIYLVPVVYIGLGRDPKRNYLITTWECITDFRLMRDDVEVTTADGGAATEQVTKVLKRYPFSGYTTHPYLEKCTYTPYAADASDDRADVWEVITSESATGVCG